MGITHTLDVSLLSRQHATDLHGAEGPKTRKAAYDTVDLIAIPLVEYPTGAVD